MNGLEEDNVKFLHDRRVAIRSKSKVEFRVIKGFYLNSYTHSTVWVKLTGQQDKYQTTGYNFKMILFSEALQYDSVFIR